MKKIIILFFIFIFCINTTIAAAKDKNYKINFNGEKYYLLYSVKDKEFGGYLNEYYKHGETYNIWSELVAVHHFPNAYSPIDRIKEFKDYLGSMNIPSSLTFDDKKNTAMIDFVIITEKKLPVVLEFNVFKYEKSKKCGSIAIQYAKRYSATTTYQIEEIKRDFENNRKKILKKLKNFEIPELVTVDIDKCISVAEVKKESTADMQTETMSDKNLVESENKKENLTIENFDNNAKNTDNKNIEEPQNIDNIEADRQEDKLVISETEAQSEIQKKEDLTVTYTKATEVDENIAKEYDKAIESKGEKTNETVKINSDTMGNKEEISNEQKQKNAKKLKKINYDKYQIVNTKDEYYAVPRTKKELKALVKQNKKRQNLVKKQAKINKKKAAKERAKQAKLKLEQ